MVSPVAGNVTFITSPPGLTIGVDGTNYTGSVSFNWPAGQTHSINVPNPQGSFLVPDPTDDADSGLRQVFADWSDGGAQSHPITVPITPIAYTAFFAYQYQLTSTVAPAGGGTIVANPPSADGFYYSGASVQLTATAKSGVSILQLEY